MLILYGYFRSSAAYRVRIGLGLKGLDYEQRPVHLRQGEQRGAEYRRLNPQGLVPALVDGDVTLTQSLAILDYLDETRPDSPLLPADPAGRARVRAIAQAIACDLHPLNNLRVLQYLSGPLGLPAERKDEWYQHWVAEGLSAVEAMLAGDPRTGRFAHGDSPGLAECCIVPQIYNAERYGCDLSAYPTLMRIRDAAEASPAVAAAHPSRQPDAEA